ncbi:GNAT family N-acetyltransferase [Kitasatospora sp. NPDC050543]|uniref:GNAT family N-acetyltransferase n=1 Tax=Kitasatospora sp. NPDC050543 TaxID=3364054 RepID=UPI0037B2B9C6
MTQDGTTHEALTVRTLDATDWPAWFRTVEIAFGGGEETPEHRKLWRRVFEPERSLGVWDGPEPVGCAGAFSFRLAVPGGAVLPAAGVTMVGVLPTYRRRGVLTALMRRQLDDVRDRGEALAVLTASEPAIYGRYGYGLGSWRLSVEIQRGRVRVHSPAADPADPGGTPLRLRLTDPAGSAAACEKLYASRVPLRPGMLERRPGWEQLALVDPESERAGFSKLQCVLAEDAVSGRLLGYARYAVKADWHRTGPAGTVRVDDVEAVGPQAYAALWAFLLDLDLTDTVAARNRPMDDPLLHLVSDPRRLQPQLSDALFVRLVDVGAALQGRGYAAPVEVVLEVEDTFCPWNSGRWQLHSEGPGKGASCLPTTAPAELALTVRELGSVYLGGVTLGALARAGRVRELGKGALTEASRAFTSDVAPWLPHNF